MGLPTGIALRIDTRKLNTRKLQGVAEEAGKGLERGWKDARESSSVQGAENTQWGGDSEHKACWVLQVVLQRRIWVWRAEQGNETGPCG